MLNTFGLDPIIVLNINPLGSVPIPGPMNVHEITIQLGGPGIQGQQQQPQQSSQPQQTQNLRITNTNSTQSTLRSTSPSETQTQGAGSHRQSETISTDRANLMQNSHTNHSHNPNVHAEAQNLNRERLDASPLEDQSPEVRWPLVNKHSNFCSLKINLQNRTLREFFIANRFNISSEAVGKYYHFEGSQLIHLLKYRRFFGNFRTVKGIRNHTSTPE